MIERKCPHCGAPIRFRTSICLLAVCAHCSSLVRRTDLDVEKLGDVAQLQPDGTPLRVGARGKHQGDAFEVVGRVQLSTGTSLWNEWSIVFNDGKQGWLGEAQGQYAVSFRAEPGDLPAYGNFKIGQKYELGKTVFRVRDLLRAHYLSAEGELPFRPPLGEDAPSVDLVAPGRKFATLDWSEGPKPLLFMGEYEEFDDLKLTGLREFEGWKAPA